jgi:hypothetical protein
LGKLGDHANPSKIFSEIKLKSFEGAQSKNPYTPLSAKRKKEEEDKVKKLGGSQFPKRKNSIHSSDTSGSKDVIT